MGLPFFRKMAVTIGRGKGEYVEGLLGDEGRLVSNGASRSGRADFGRRRGAAGLKEAAVHRGVVRGAEAATEGRREH